MKTDNTTVHNILEQNYQNRYQNLNTMQKKAVDITEGPVLVVAGPGSGKTELLAIRAANILRSSQVSASNILLLTFTNSGAVNMRERLVNIIGEEAYRIAVYTFHSFASDIMGRYGEYFFEGSSFRVATDTERYGALELIFSRLSRSDTLSSYHPEKGYVYLSETLTLISNLKRGNLSSSDFKSIIEINESNYREVNNAVGELLAEYSGRTTLERAMHGFDMINLKLAELEANNTVARYLYNVLSLELKYSIERVTHTNLYNFRDKYFTKDEDNKSDYKVFKDSLNRKVEKWKSFVNIYKSYEDEMYKLGLYDYDDMIMLVNAELKKRGTLLAELQEKYLYVMVDEFQDTNDSQFQLIQSLTSSDINEGRPNVLAVGDDDQAIYKFQGAELDNITKFVKGYREVEIITLDKNYRSTQEILDNAKNIITKVEDRLEVRFPGQINKNIKAENKRFANTGTGLGQIIEKTFPNVYLEQDYVAREISKIIQSGVKPSEISVISRSHENLKSLSELMSLYKIPYSYEKKENVLDKQHIREILNIVTFANSGLADTGVREDLLPEILSYKFFGIDRLSIWKVAEKVRIGHTIEGDLGESLYTKLSWLTAMLESEDKKIVSVAEFLIDLIADAKVLPLEHLIDKIIGTTEWEIEEDITNLEDIISAPVDGAKDKPRYISPYKAYYFGADNFLHNRPLYLDFLFALRTFMGALREYKQGAMLKACDLEDFVKLYENNSSLSLTLVSPFSTSADSVILQTAHKSKGLEYEYVFIINSDESEWAGRGKTHIIGLPVELGLMPKSDDLADKIRLYYVSMTRAKHTLYITNNESKFSILIDAITKTTSEDNTDTTRSDNVVSNHILNSLELGAKSEYITDEVQLLRRLLENYKMPVTHLINFLDFSKIGPERFIEQNLLRFPQAMSPNSVYGSAMHEALQNFYLFYKKYSQIPDLTMLKGYFKNAMSRGVIAQSDFDKFLDSGYKSLDTYYHDLISRVDDNVIRADDMVEVNFASEGVYLNGAHLSGKIDKMQFQNNTIRVTDLKTGKSFERFDEKGLTDFDKIKLHFYKYQLAYYALLIKNSRTYSNYNVEYGYIEFIEPDKSTGKINIIELRIDEELLERVSKLTEIVYTKIMNLDFPNTTKYSSENGMSKKEIKLKDILDFEEDLLSGSV